MYSFISQNCVRRLGLRKRASSVNTNGISSIDKTVRILPQSDKTLGRIDILIRADMIGQIIMDGKKIGLQELQSR